MSEEDRPSIGFRENGPAVVRSLPKLIDADGAETVPGPVVALCRCGGSSKKPFCDGTHQKIGFSDARITDKPLLEEQVHEGNEIRIHDNRVICCHNGACTESLPAAFQVGRSPWIDAKAAQPDEFVTLTRKCPSGALAHEIGDKLVRDFDRDPQIRIEKNGPILVQGSIELGIDEALQPPSREHFALCRCGASKNKPYCDGSHYTIKFRDDS